MMLKGPVRHTRRARQLRPAALAIALGLSVLPAAAPAQGISPGDLPKDGYRLPGGIEPVLQLRTYYFDQ